ncbi:MAG: hypothetical protein HY066_10700 [Betaproteobacteria bacterium]|nr:hypothetical protein [Betaproteobacteria bacterium]
MVIVMSMDTGRRIEDEFGAFEEQVLNAEWQPAPQTGLQTALQTPVRHPERHAMPDADAFLRSVYLCQE